MRASSSVSPTRRRRTSSSSSALPQASVFGAGGVRLTQADLAKLLRSSQSRVAKMEIGDPSVSLDLLVRSLLALGASTIELSRIISARLARSCRLT